MSYSNTWKPSRQRCTASGVVGRSPEVYEGDIGADIVIIEFPSLSSAQDWYTSDEYKEIIPLRARNCHSIVAVIEGVSSDYSTSETIARLRSATAQQTLP